MRYLVTLAASFICVPSLVQAQIQWGETQPAGKAATRDVAPAELPATKAPFIKPGAAQQAISRQANAPQPQIDACTGKPASAPLKVFAGRPALAVASGQMSVKGVNPYPGSGSGPIPMISDWYPRGRMAKGSEITIQGRDLVPGQVFAMIGGSQLTATSQSPGQIKFRADDLTPGDALVVYNKNGQPRVLEAKYAVFDPAVVVTKVVPQAFGVGDTVTICGTSLFQAILGQMASDTHYNNVPDYGTLKLLPGNFVGVGDKWIRVDNVSVSPSGDRMVFTVGTAFTDMPACNQAASCNTPQGLSWFLMPITPPSPLAGPIKLGISGGAGPAVTWQSTGLQPPSISRVYANLSTSQVPFLIAADVSAPGYNSSWGMVVVEGTNLSNSTWRIGSTPITSAIDEPSQTKLILPGNAASGQICATKNGQTSCTPGPFQIYSGPLVSRVPPMPLALHTNYTIEGANLKGPNVPGVTFRFDIFGLAADCAMGAGCINTPCNRDLQIIEHTAQKIVFRLGDPAKPTPAMCKPDDRYLQKPENQMYIWVVPTGGGGNAYWKAAYYLKATP